MTALKQIDQSKGILHALGLGMATLGLLLVSASAFAGNVLQDVRYAAAPGGKVDITLQFAGPVGEVQAFTTDSPPRIAIDLPNTSNGLNARRVAIGSGATSAVSAAEAGGRTRVVVDLFRPAGYTTRSSGNQLVVTVDAGSIAQSGASSAMASKSDPTKHVASNLQVANIDFRRGDNGAGRIILRFSGEGANADMRSEGAQVVVDVNNAQIPENLRRRMDVTDFATPVVNLDPSSNGGSTRLVINTNGDYDSMAYQTGNEYVIEVSPKRGQVIAASAGRGMRAAGAVDSNGATARYSGKPVTFNFQDVPVRTVLQLIAEESNLNIVASDTVGGNLTLRLINVPWDQALEIVLRAKGLDKRRDGNVVWVAPQAELASYEQALNTARIALENSAPLVSEYIPINFGNALDIAALIQNPGQSSASGGAQTTGQSRGFLSTRGSITADARTNTLLVVDTADKIAEIKKLLITIDRAVDQVLIEARIVVASETFARDLGVKFGVGNVNNPSNSSSTTTNDGFNINLPVAGAAGTFNLSILRASSSIDLELSALESEGRGEVISNPRVITSNQREAIITQGDEIGYFTTQQAASGSTGVAQSTAAFKDVLLELKVTPTITQDGRVYLNLSVKKDDVKSFITNDSGSIPTITKRSVSTAVLVDNGQTVVIGGVYEFKSRDDITKVPFFGDVPFLGNLFKKRGKSTDKAELLVFVTPRVLQVTRH
ncbi:MAG TPA: type IV pilus secretin PilQ [Luteimonas sp.]|nr:type IV pilus secretin PilQ [Luteimonas sp.]